MNEDDVLALTKALKIDAEKSRKWVNFKCIFAPWLHANGTDRHKSAGISINNRGVSSYHCYSCKESGNGNSSTLVEIFDRYRNFLITRNKSIPENMTKLLNWIEDKYFEDINKYKNALEAGEITDKPPSIDVVLSDMTVYPEYHLDRFFKKDVAPYVNKRDVNEKTVLKWQVGLDDNNQRITFPIRRPDGKLVGLVGRSLRKNDPKYFNYWGFRRASCLFGAQFLTPDTTEETLVVVEGPFDALRVSQAGFKVVASLGAMISYDQTRIIRRFADKKVCVLYDGDKSGSQGSKLVKDSLAGFVPVRIVRPDDGEDPGAMTDERIKELLS